MEHSLIQFEVLKRASLFLERHHREQNIAPLLLQHYLGVSRTQFHMRMRSEVSAEVLHHFWKAMEEHATTGVPLEHLTGEASFYGRAFFVNRDVLIPRPETEELVEKVLHFVHEKYGENGLSMVDIGTGSGVIAVTLALELKEAMVYATDISKKALAMAEKNADSYSADVTFFEGDMLRPLIDNAIQPDIIVSNPPYIAEEDALSLDDTVRNFDPGIALFASEDGLAFYRRLFEEVQAFSALPRLIALEIGETQGEAIKQLANNMLPYSTVYVKKDINEKDRIMFVEMDVRGGRGSIV